MPRDNVVAMKTVIAIAAALAICAAASFAAQTEIPPDLVQIEREVSLKLAHARGIGYTDRPRIEKLSQAEKYDHDGEAAMKAGDYHAAENDFLKAKLILHDLGI